MKSNRRNWNAVTRSNILAHIAVNAAVEDVKALYGAAGVQLAERLVTEGAAIKSTRNGYATYNLSAAERARRAADFY